MFIDQICQKKKAHWLRPDISEYTINNKYYVKFIEYCAHFIASPYIHYDDCNEEPYRDKVFAAWKNWRRIFSCLV